jgi:adenylylsulfate kinase-like enzyme
MRLRRRRIGTKAKIYQSRIILTQTAIISNYHLSQGRTKEESKKEERKENIFIFVSASHKKGARDGKTLLSVARLMLVSLQVQSFVS